MTKREKGPKELEAEEEEIGKLFLGIMDGYQDSVIPPLKQFSPLKKVCSSSRNDSPETDPIHIMKERYRRDQMAENYSILQSQVPNLISIPKVSREKIVSETINYIQSLEEEKKRLEGLKNSILQQKMAAKPVLKNCIMTNSKTSVNVSVCSGVAFFGIQLMVEKGSLIKIFKIFEEYKVEVIVATILVNDHGQLTLTCEFKVGGSHGVDVIEKIKNEILSL